ncbi:o-succinylbenzoate synthase [Enterococcus villorum]|uniref:o-succinylbenzoate synthase n=1 Tax=Enterococcus villorum TaxID=112904 RepID=A0A1V8YGM5_9ENTE|nr:o-succinylbenzoate synthase [Enterococcus villorum]OQO71466.1 o-succinylbenzoate synthase [Enterococcus villorum]OQO76641.1 o-succinylbenzoate synthase [Enterococcus villorum]
MQITKISQLQFKLPLVTPFKTSYGTLTEKAFDLLILEDELGNQGIGELLSFQQADYIEETLEMSRLIIKKELIPLLTQHTFTHPSQIHKVFTKVQGNFMAKSALETAYWDLYAKRHNCSLNKYLAGTKTEIFVGISLGIQPTLEELLKQTQKYVAQGYQRLKLKIKPGFDVQPLTLLRQEFPDLLLMADANSAYTLQDLPIFLEMDHLNLSMIEQPFDQRDFVDHAFLQKQLKTAICLDENIRTLKDVQTAYELRSCRAINLKIPRVGGLTEALAITKFCREHDLLVWIGGMFESGVGRAINLQFASQDVFTFPGDISASNRYYYDDIVEEKAILKNGKIKVPSGNGHGAILDQQKVFRYCIHEDLLFFG